MTSSQLCWKGPGVLSSTNTRSCLHVMGCTNASCCILDECEHVLWCGCVVGAGKKREEAKDTVKQKPKGHFPKPLFPFSLFSTSFSSTLFSFPSTLPPSFPSYQHTPLFHASHMGAFVKNQKHQITQHPIHFIVFSFCSNSLFLFFSFCK